MTTRIPPHQLPETRTMWINRARSGRLVGILPCASFHGSERQRLSISKWKQIQNSAPNSWLHELPRRSTRKIKIAFGSLLRVVLYGSKWKPGHPHIQALDSVSQK